MARLEKVVGELEAGGLTLEQSLERFALGMGLAREAQRKLDALVDDWQKELGRMEKEWQEKFNDYDKRKLILTDQGRANAERELQDLDHRIAEFRDKKFGQSGELFSKEDELMKPIQDLVFDQVKMLAMELGYDYVLDKSGGVMIIYAKDSYDLTKQVIDRIEKTLPPRQISGQGQDNTRPQPGQPAEETGAREAGSEDRRDRRGGQSRQRDRV